MIFRLDPKIPLFPDPALAEEDGLLAVGGDLSSERLQQAYASGIFPWYSEEDPILWYAPHERCVLFPARIKISKSMRRVLRRETFTITMDQAFGAVITACADIPRKDQPGTWINKDMIAAYTRLHKQGIAHSIEVWQDGELAGGLYGVAVGAVFCGESMFSRKTNASKAALLWLCSLGRYRLIDCQIPNDHLLSLGAEMISRGAYMEWLGKA